MYKHTLDEIRFINRWSAKHPPGDWTILGIAKYWFSPNSYAYRFCIVGFEMHVWILRTWYPKSKQ